MINSINKTILYQNKFTGKTITPYGVKLHRLFDLNRDRLNEFPRGDEFFGRVWKVERVSDLIKLNVRPIVGIQKLKESKTINFIDNFGHIQSFPFFLERAEYFPFTNNISIFVSKPLNYEGEYFELENYVTTNSNLMPFRTRIRANYDDQTITVYQAFGDKIANEALSLQKFGTALKRNRYTWIKPSFLWILIRSSFAEKERQSRILAIKLMRKTFEELLRQACLTNPVLGLFYQNLSEYKSDAEKFKNRVQWDPDKFINGKRSYFRALQLGIHPDNYDLYNEGIVKIEDVTFIAKAVKSAYLNGENFDLLLPDEIPYPTPIDLLKRLEMNQYSLMESPKLLKEIEDQLI